MKHLFLSFLLFQTFVLTLTEDLDVYYKDYIKKCGYELEENPVTTEDGFILSVWHLQPKKPNGKVVFLQHGLADTAWTFFQLKHKSLPFFLLQEGYDLWLGNIRGSIFSSKHTTKKIKADYNNFTIDEFVKYDLPAMVDYVKSRTGVKKLSYIAHSQGSTMFFMLTMNNPEYVQNNFDHFASVGTVPNIAHTHFTPIEILDKISGILKAVKIFDTINLSNAQRNLVSGFCKLTPGICGKFFDLASALHPSKRMNYTDIYNFMYYYPGGVSKTNLLHWSQIHKMKQLVYYNPNFEKEQTAVPYNVENLKKWKIKSLIARTDDDTFSSYEDVTEFYMNVEDKSLIEILDLKDYSHLDVLAAESAYEEIYMPIINFLKY
jgi:pimeloyl-ACP methyl ester carboxylesterase